MVGRKPFGVDAVVGVDSLSALIEDRLDCPNW